MKKFFKIIFLLSYCCFFGQNVQETAPPYHIKTISFLQNQNNVFPFFELGESFELNFDDLYGNEEDYFYIITHHDYNWSPSQLFKNEYIEGLDDQRIQEYENSFNTLQIYSHYRLQLPNRFTRITKSGNYLLSVYNNSKELVFSRKFIVYENIASVPMQIKRARNVKDNASKHNVEFTIKSKDILFQNPDANVKVAILQNGILNQGIYNIKPQFTVGNDLVFKYDKETQFYAQNEYWFVDTKEIRAANNVIAKVDSKGGLYNHYLYTNNARRYDPYTFYPDVNGNFEVRVLGARNSDVEADYSWVYFTLFAPQANADAHIYITGMFNNNAFYEGNKMTYNVDKGVFEKALLIKQGFFNYKYSLVNNAGKIDYTNAVDGNFFETENIYTTFVYYRSNTDRFDRIIGKGQANSTNIIN